MRITTLPVYSRLCIPSDVPDDIRQSLPDDLRLSQHQLDTFMALVGQDYDVVINSAMTGDGKSLAAQLPTLSRGQSLLMTYPTNELVVDQQAQLRTTLARWHKSNALRVTTLTAERLNEIMASDLYSRKAAAIRSLAANNDIVLTNPDILHYVAQFYYTRQGDAPDKLLGRLLDLFDLFVFDEFHIFRIPEVMAVVNAMLLMSEISGRTQPKKFLFLSATPSGLLAEYLQRAGFRVKVVHPLMADDYLHTWIPPRADEWRQIIRGSEVNFWTYDRVENWVNAHLEDVLLGFFKRHGAGAKGAIIVNSVMTARRIVDQLQPVFARNGLRVLPNTGLTSRDIKQASREANLLVGTSTVDVGVDFRINFLAFESSGAATFLQRLGRLGRHDSDEHGNSFRQFEAHALVPNFVSEILFDGHGAHEPPLLSEGGEYSRQALADKIQTAFPLPTEFRSYVREWGWIQAAHIYKSLASPTVKESYTDTRNRLKQRYWDTFGISIGRALHNYKETPKPILREAQSFRGGSPFVCGIIDDTEAQLLRDLNDNEMTGYQRVKQYDLCTLAANADLTWLSPTEFRAIAQKLGGWLGATPVDDLAGWFRLRGFRPDRLPVDMVIQDDLAFWDTSAWGMVRVVTGVALDVPDSDWLQLLNRHLRQRQFVALLCQCEPNELRYRLHLPPLFGIYRFVSRDGIRGSIVFGREALMLQAAIKDRRFECGGSAVFL